MNEYLIPNDLKEYEKFISQQLEIISEKTGHHKYTFNQIIETLYEYLPYKDIIKRPLIGKKEDTPLIGKKEDTPFEELGALERSISKQNNKKFVTMCLPIPIIRQVFSDEIENEIKKIKDNNKKIENQIKIFKNDPNKKDEIKKLQKQKKDIDWKQIHIDNKIPDAYNILQKIIEYQTNEKNYLVAYGLIKSLQEYSKTNKVPKFETSFFYNPANTFNYDLSKILEEDLMGRELNYSSISSGINQSLRSNFNIDETINGEKSPPVYLNKRNNSIIFYFSGNAIKFEKEITEENYENYYFYLPLIKGEKIKFLLKTKKDTEYILKDLNNYINGSKECNSLSISFDKKNKMTANFSIKRDIKDHHLDINRIVGIDRGIKNSTVCSLLEKTNNEYNVLEPKLVLFGNAAKKITDNQERGDRHFKKDMKYLAKTGHGTKRFQEQHIERQKKYDNQRKKIIEKNTFDKIKFAINNCAGTIKIEYGLSNMKNKEGYEWLKNWIIYYEEELLKRKCKENGIILIAVNPKNTSKTCSKCGYVNEDLDFKERMKVKDGKFLCPICELHEYFDYNAAINIGKTEKDLTK